MKFWVIFFRISILIISIIVLSFNVLLYNFCEKQKNDISTMSNQQKVDAQVNNNKFKYQQEQIERLSKDLENVRQQIKDQKLALADQKEDNKNIQTSLVDIKAEADAIKEDMKGWQKDYVSVLAELEKKMDDSHNEIKDLEDNLVGLNIPELKESIKSLRADIEKITHPPDNSLSNTPPAADNKDDQSPLGSP